ncbi:MAG TPA: exopolysaccharide biosynthesis polyprenyl glycosylphosphotransferase [Candidatus Dormibacteraeota bacterium]|nr:exopolysaccharide biosynthesis polyprenyl glycosylphosphotransferase [Candidatus Dormibacteraeota bacterium]
MTALEIQPPDPPPGLEIAPQAAARRFALSIRERRVVLAAADFVVAAVATLAAYGVLHKPKAHPLEGFEPLLIGAIWVVSLIVTDGYAPQIPSNRVESGVAVVKALPISALFSVVVFFIHPYVLTRPILLGAIGLSAVLMIAVRTTVARVLLHESLATQVVVIADEQPNPELVTALQAARFEYRVVGTVVRSRADTHDAPWIVEQASSALARTGAQELIVSSNELRLVPGLIEECLTRGVRLVPGVSLVETYMGRVPLDSIDVHWYLGLPDSDVWKRPYAAARRLLDLLLSVVVGVPFLVLFPLLALMIRLDSKGPVILTQRRVGESGREFNLLKLRTMSADAEAHGAQFAAPKDPRITRVGRLLRATRLDEFPQLLNIIRGEMSFIGPRPERPEFERDLEAKVPHFRSRLLIKPGLTGWAQIKGGYAGNVAEITRKLEYDLYYIKNRSFRLDLQILAGTFGTVLGWRGR